MRIFVFEYVTGGGLSDQPMVAGIAREGDMMLTALIGDLLDIAGVQVSTSRDARLIDLGLGATVHRVANRDDLLSVWSEQVRSADAVWPIAPETDGVLEFLCGWVLWSNRTLLNSRPQGVALAASKLVTARRLGECSLPVVPTWSAREPSPPGDNCWVLKPDRGVGCMGARLVRGRPALADAVSALSPFEDWVVQPYVPGQSASLSLLVSDEGCELLGCNLQRIALEDDSFVLLGCEVNGLGGDWASYAQLGRNVARALPGLWGYVGVDLVITDGGPVILEVNPRLTTSYAGLSRSLGMNVAAMVMDLLRNDGLVSGARQVPKRVEVELGGFGLA
jgi:tyramine---L-glutamate ligase